jgi:hypothetical protein
MGTSRAFSMDSNDIMSIVKNALLVGVAAILTYVGENLSNIDLGHMGPLLVPVVAVVINTLIKWAKDNSQSK